VDTGRGAREPGSFQDVTILLGPFDLDSKRW
jgi:hypothetical protein